MVNRVNVYIFYWYEKVKKKEYYDPTEVLLNMLKIIY